MKIWKQFGDHFGAFWEGVCSIFDVHYPEPPFERIVLIPGVNSPAIGLRPLHKFLQKHFPQVQVITVQEYYFHVQNEKVSSVISRTVDALGTDKKTLVIGHSFGGIVARAAIARLASHDHIVLLATLASPHSIEDFRVKESIVLHEVPDHCNVPVLTFGGRADMVVPEKFTRLSCAVGHVTISCTHMAFLRASRTRKEVLASIMQYLSMK